MFRLLADDTDSNLASVQHFVHAGTVLYTEPHASAMNDSVDVLRATVPPAWLPR